VLIDYLIAVNESVEKILDAAMELEEKLKTNLLIIRKSVVVFVSSV
jgi:hypothetical protein